MLRPPGYAMRVTALTETERAWMYFVYARPFPFVFIGKLLASASHSTH